MEPIKLVFTDMDGTLLHNDKTCPKEFYDIVKDLTKRNILVGIASGRSYISLADTFSSIKDDLIYIADNGTAIYYKNECIYNDSMDFNDLKLIHELIKPKTDSYMIFCGLKGAYVFRTDNEVFRENTRIYYRNINEIEKIDDIDDVIIKIAIYESTDALHNLMPLFKDLKPELLAVNSSQNWVDISNNGVSKGSALKLVQKYFNIKYEETMSFGDYINDLELLEASYYSYAMENAVTEIKNVSRFRAPSNQNDGVIKVLKDYFY